MKRGIVVLLCVQIMSIPLSGCLGNDNVSNDGSTGEKIIDEDFQLLDYIECIVHEDIERCWNVFVPESVQLVENPPLIIDLHGHTVTMEEQRSLSEFDEIAEENGAIVVWPQGHENSWNAGYCCGTASELQMDDTSLILKILDNVVANHSVDEKRVYLSGWSNGCAFSQKLASENSEKFAASACMSYYLLEEPQAEYSPIPIMEIHGFLDQIVPYSNDARFLPNLDAPTHGAIQNLLQWAEMNECDGNMPNSNTPSVFYSTQSFTNCANNTEVTLVTLYAADHNPYEEDWGIFPGNGGTVDTNGIAWEFLSRFSK